MSTASDYDSFSEIYETFKGNDDYAAWFEILNRIVSIHRESGKSPGLAWDIGTGTGLMARCLASAGWKVIGTDISEGMLNRAIANGPDSIQYRLADIRYDSIPEKAEYAIAIDDVINTLSTVESVRSAFANVFRGLNANGLFQFDLNTAAVFEHDMGEASLSRRDGALVLMKPLHRYAPESHEPAVVRISVIKETVGGTVVHESTQSEYYYSPILISQCLAEAGFDLVSITGMDQDGRLYSDYRDLGPTKLLFLARKSISNMKGGD